MVHLVILILSVVSFVDASSINNNIGTIEDNINRLYENNLTNFKNTLAFIDNVDGSADKITAFQALVGAMKDSDHLYSPEIMQFAHKFKQFIDESKDVSKAKQQQIEDIKQVLPGSVRTGYFCPSFKIKQVDLNQYLAGSKRPLDKDNRYVFFTENPDEIGTDYKIEIGESIFRIKNIFYQEYLYMSNKENYLVLQWMDTTMYTWFYWEIESVYGTDYVTLKSRYYDKYMYDSGVNITGKRVPKGADKPLKSWWLLECSQNSTKCY